MALADVTSDAMQKGPPYLYLLRRRAIVVRSMKLDWRGVNNEPLSERGCLDPTQTAASSMASNVCAASAELSLLGWRILRSGH